MPLTFAHPAIVLPFSKLTKRWLSLTGLVIGSMAPDFEYFIRMRLVSAYSHTWPGLIWFDLPLGVMLVIIYEFWVKDPLITHLPTALNRRFFSFKGYREYYSLQYFFAIFLSVLIGAASHIFWDGFTHRAGYFVHQIPELQSIINFYGYSVHIYTVLQYASTAAGALLILTVCFMLPKGKLTRPKQIAGFWLQVLLVAMVTIAIKLATGLPLYQYGNVLITVIDGGLLGLVVASFLEGSH
ncbi:MAG TPA: DUF4184 family protein [Mucilaginibacter sp.]|jgi:hypothetical protein